MWLTVALIASPLGIVTGYGLTFAMIKYATWEWSFYIQSIAICPFILIIIFTPSHYFDVEATVKFKQECSEKMASVALQDTQPNISIESERIGNVRAYSERN